MWDVILTIGVSTIVSIIVVKISAYKELYWAKFWYETAQEDRDKFMKDIWDSRVLIENFVNKYEDKTNGC